MQHFAGPGPIKQAAARTDGDTCSESEQVGHNVHIRPRTHKPQKGQASGKGGQHGQAPPFLPEKPPDHLQPHQHSDSTEYRG